MPQRAYFYPDMDLVQSASPGITVTQGSFKKVPSVLSSLVEEPEKRHAVPSHLLESSKFLLSDCSQTCGISRTHLLLFFFFLKLLSCCLNCGFLRAQIMGGVARKEIVAVLFLADPKFWGGLLRP